ncbi:Chitinase [Anopheles sinensis]|uniref:Chitinase n=1 Tax=Anopheles sinensis TaxID=74873 RepID=A0A084W1J5_ANOSI|nr:Chitinase [Anopheles sinensis]
MLSNFTDRAEVDYREAYRHSPGDSVDPCGVLCFQCKTRLVPLRVLRGWFSRKKKGSNHNITTIFRGRDRKNGSPLSACCNEERWFLGSGQTVTSSNFQFMARPFGTAEVGANRWNPRRAVVSFSSCLLATLGVVRSGQVASRSPITNGPLARNENSPTTNKDPVVLLLATIDIFREVALDSLSFRPKSE